MESTIIKSILSFKVGIIVHIDTLQKASETYI